MCSKHVPHASHHICTVPSYNGPHSHSNPSASQSARRAPCPDSRPYTVHFKARQTTESQIHVAVVRAQEFFELAARVFGSFLPDARLYARIACPSRPCTALAIIPLNMVYSSTQSYSKLTVEQYKRRGQVREVHYSRIVSLSCTDNQRRQERRARRDDARRAR